MHATLDQPVALHLEKPARQVLQSLGVKLLLGGKQRPPRMTQSQIRPRVLQMIEMPELVDEQPGTARMFWNSKVPKAGP